MQNDYKKHLFALILAGGGGTRLWPKSLEKTPKQFLRLFGKKTLTQITYDRLNNLIDPKNIYFVTVSDEYKKEIQNEIPHINENNIIVEPARRDTAPAHGLGAMYILERDKDAVIITEAADRLVEPVERYIEVLDRSAKFAYENKVLVAIGVKPRYPHTGLGHIKRGKNKIQAIGIKVFKLVKFVEKPRLDLATRYTKSGEFYWNAGQYVWRADVLLEAIKRNNKSISDQLEKIRETFNRGKNIEILKEYYEDMPKISIDYAVSEKEKNMYVVEGDFFWTDIGDWKEVWENLAKDSVGNVIIDGDEPGGEIINIETSDTLIHKDGRMIAVVDVDNIVIVDTKKALLVCSKSKAQNVKKIVEILKLKNYSDLL